MFWIKRYASFWSGFKPENLYWPEALFFAAYPTIMLLGVIVTLVLALYCIFS